MKFFFFFAVFFSFAVLENSKIGTFITAAEERERALRKPDEGEEVW